MEESIIYIIGAFLGGGAAKSLADYIINRVKNNKKDTFEKLFDDIHNIYSILNHIKRETFAKRILVMVAENGGGVPDVNSELNSSILYETYDYPFKSSKEEWQNQPLNDSHLAILRNMYINGRVEFTVDELTRGILKDNMVSNGVHHAEFHLIVGTEMRLYYLALHYNKEYDLTASNRNVVRTAVAKLKPIFENKGEKL